MAQEQPNLVFGFASPKCRSYLSIALPAGIFIVAFLFYFYNVRLFSPFTFPADGPKLVGDTSQIADAMRQVSFRGYDSDCDECECGFCGDMMKHILFSITTAPPVRAFQDALAISQDDAIMIVLAMIAALNIAGVFLLLKGFFSSAPPALLFTFLFASFFYNLVLFSFPETYALSDLLILIYLFFLLKVRENLTWRSSLGLSFLAGLASLYNPPLLSLAMIHVIILYYRSEAGSWVKLALSNLSFAVLVFLSVNLLISRSSFVEYFFDYGGQRFLIHNILDWRNAANVFVNFFFYSILSPIGHLPGYLGLGDLSGYWQSPLRLALWVVTASGIFYGIIVAIINKTKYQGLALSLLAWIMLMMLFYVFWDPDDAALFSLQILIPLLLLLAIAFQTIPSRALFRYGSVFFVSALIAHTNSLAFYAGPLLK